MRSPGSGGTGTGGVESAVGGVGRASSPSSPRIPRDKNGVAGIGLGTGGTSSSSSGKDNNNAVGLEKNPLRDLHVHVRQVQLALLHFRDVVSKKKLEMLPGNGTVVLDTVTTIHTVLKSYLLYENR